MVPVETPRTRQVGYVTNVSVGLNLSESLACSSLLFSPAYFQSILKPAFEHPVLPGNQETLNTNVLFEPSYLMKKSTRPQEVRSGSSEMYKRNLSLTSSLLYTKAQ